MNLLEGEKGGEGRVGERGRVGRGGEGRGGEGGMTVIHIVIGISIAIQYDTTIFK